MFTYYNIGIMKFAGQSSNGKSDTETFANDYFPRYVK